MMSIEHDMATIWLCRRNGIHVGRRMAKQEVERWGSFCVRFRSRPNAKSAGPGNFVRVNHSDQGRTLTSDGVSAQ